MASILLDRKKQALAGVVKRYCVVLLSHDG
jgi:hypothetical protein